MFQKCFKLFWVHVSAKDSLRSAKNVFLAYSEFRLTGQWRDYSTTPAAPAGCVTGTSRGGVEDTRLEAKDKKKSKAKHSPSEDRPSRGQGQECLRLRPRTTDTTRKWFPKKRKKKRSSLQNFVNFWEISSVLQKLKCLQNFFRRLSGVLQDVAKLVLTLAHFQQIKK